MVLERILRSSRATTRSLSKFGVLEQAAAASQAQDRTPTRADRLVPVTFKLRLSHSSPIVAQEDGTGSGTRMALDQRRRQSQMVLQDLMVLRQVATSTPLPVAGRAVQGLRTRHQAPLLVEVMVDTAATSERRGPTDKPALPSLDLPTRLSFRLAVLVDTETTSPATLVLAP